MRIYVSGPLQGSQDLDAARDLYDQLAVLIAQVGHDAYVPHHNTDPDRMQHLTAEIVFLRDVEALESCDAVIAHIGAPSTGVGAELAIALSAGRPVLGVKRPGEKGSRFAEGLIARSGGRVAEFGSSDELADVVARWSADAAAQIAWQPRRPLATPMLTSSR